MSRLALRVERLAKAYTIRRTLQTGTYRTMREELSNLFKRPSAGDKITIWALRDATFDVHDGEVLGVIGRNGAGKSTLLKLIARITEPTEGRIAVYGRVGTLLEVGTGFHPELTGRENVFLSGAILGMKRREIAAALDAIFDFADIGPYADTPVKRYSSGMFMRLAFSVAAHLEPEILIVDEVLAVGDAEFQKKCLGKMRDVSQSGRTVLFVSHNMAAVQQLCSRGIVLDRGRMVFDGNVDAAIGHYLESNRAAATETLEERIDRRGSGHLVFTRVELVDHNGSPLSVALSGRDLRIRFHYRSDFERPDALVNVAFNIRSPQGYLLTNLNNVDTGQARLPLFRTGYFECVWPRLNLRSGAYDCTLFCSVDSEVVDWLQNAFRLEVEDGDFHGTGRLIQRDQGDLLVEHSWTAARNP
jgi:homopolymeric O-antigen transport system ATP-binding protein